MTDVDDEQVREILAKVKPLAAEYYRLTGKPLGITGEVAEYVAAKELGLTLVAARTVGYDALRGAERIQIKGRAFGESSKQQRISRIKADAPCDSVLLVLLDNLTLEPREMWEAKFSEVCEILAKPGSRARERGALSVSEFKRIAWQVWPNETKSSKLQQNMCPECGYRFKGNGFDGIDAHWRSRHENVMPYTKAWPAIKLGTYVRQAT